MAFDGNDLVSINVDSMIRTFPEEIKTILLHVSDEITPFGRHAEPQWAIVL